MVFLNIYNCTFKTPFCKSSHIYEQEVLAEEISKLEVKGAIKKHQAHLIGPLFVVPKSEGGWQPITDLQQITQYIDPHNSR